MTKTRKSFIAFAALSQLVLVARLAQANDPAAAEVLFREGRKLMTEGRIAAGCEKLKDSFALDPMSGTLLNLADCYEKQGRFATAWARFQNAVSLAKNQGKRDQAAEANRRMKSLEAELSYLTIEVPDPVPGLEVRRDDIEVLPASYGVQLPSDSGTIVVTGSAPGFKTVKITVEVGARRDKKSVTLPKLVELEKGEVAEPAVPTSDDERPVEETESKPEGQAKESAPVEVKTSNEAFKAPEPEIVGSGPGRGPLIVGGLGLAIAATGGVFGFMATQSNRDALLLCPARRNCPKTALDAEKKRDTQALIANVGVGVGLAVVATAAIWMAVGGSSSDRDSARITLQPAVTPSTAGLWASTHF